MASSDRCSAPVPVVRLLLALLFACTIPARTLRAADETSYEQKIAAAKALAAQGAWTKARDAYSEALAIAPDADARRWCQLWLNSVAWRAPMPWSPDADPRKTLQDFFDAQLKPYDDGKTRDEYWAGLKAGRADFLKDYEGEAAVWARLGDQHSASWSSLDEQTEKRISWDDQLDVADYLKTLPPSPAVAHRYVEWLQKTVAMLGIVHRSSAGTRLRAHLADATLLDTSPEDAAWCLLAHARATSDDARLPIAERDLNWSRAFAASQGTRWEAQARATELIWRIRRIGGPNPPARTPKDLAAALAELTTMRRDLGPANQTVFPGDPNSLDDFRQKLERPELKVTGPELVAPGQPASFSYAAANLDSLHATLVRLPWEQESRSLIPAAFKSGADPVVVRAWEIPLADKRPGIWNTAVIEAAPSLSPGDYSLKIECRSAAARPIEDIRFTVSDLAVTAISTSLGATEAFVSRRSDGQPVANTAVNGMTVVSGQVPRAFQVRTDAEGRVKIPASGCESRSYRPETVAMVVAGELFRFNRSLPPPNPKPLSLHFATIVDQASYLPGETVRWKIVAWDCREGRFFPPRTTCGISARLNGARLLDNAPVEFNRSYLARGRIVIPPDAQPGKIAITLTSSQSGSEDPITWLCEQLPVARPVPPPVTARIELASGADSLRPGHEVILRVAASDPSGQPLINTPVQCSFYYYQNWEPSPSTRDQAIAQWQKGLCDQPLHATTGADGVAEFRLRLHPAAMNASTLTASVSLFPHGAAEVKIASWQGAISPTGVLLGQPREWRDAQLHTLDSDWIVSVMTCDGTGAPAAFAGEARLVEKRWDETWADPSGTVVTGADLQRVPLLHADPGGSNRQGWRMLHGDYAETVVATRSAKSGRDGRIKTRFSLPHPGIFQVQFWREGAPLAGERADDGAGPTVYALAAETTTLALNPYEAYLFGPASTKPGESIVATVILPEGTSQGWLSLVGDSEVITRRIAPPGRIARIAFVHPPRLTGSGRLQLSVPSRRNAQHGIIGPEAESPPGAAEVDRLLKSRPGECWIFFNRVINPTPAEAKELEDAAKDDSFYRANATLAGTRVSGPWAGRSPTSSYLMMNDDRRVLAVEADYLGFRQPVMPQPWPDTRIKPILIGDKYGYCPEIIGGIVISPFHFSD